MYLKLYLTKLNIVILNTYSFIVKNEKYFIM